MVQDHGATFSTFSGYLLKIFPDFYICVPNLGRVGGMTAVRDQKEPNDVSISCYFTEFEEGGKKCKQFGRGKFTTTTRTLVDT